MTAGRFALATALDKIQRQFPVKTHRRMINRVAEPRVIEFTSRSPLETHRFGKRLASILDVPGVMLLQGSLGTGKTTLTRGVVEGLGLKDGSQVNSPSFTLVNLYHARCPVYHVDLYRISGGRDLRSIGLDDFLGSKGVTIVEWSERLGAWPDPAIQVQFEDAGNDRRRIRLILPPGSRDLPGRSAYRYAKSDEQGKRRVRTRRMGK